MNQLDKQYSLTASLPSPLPFVDQTGNSRKASNSSSSVKSLEN